MEHCKFFFVHDLRGSSKRAKELQRMAILSHAARVSQFKSRAKRILKQPRSNSQQSHTELSSSNGSPQPLPRAENIAPSSSFPYSDQDFLSSYHCVTNPCGASPKPLHSPTAATLEESVAKDPKDSQDLNQALLSPICVKTSSLLLSTNSERRDGNPSLCTT
jgi:hypothetical protein